MKLKVFLWLMLMNRLNTKEMLHKKNFNIQGGINCLMCNSLTEESMAHLFFSCPFVQQCWQHIGINWNLALEFMNMITSAQNSFHHSFFFEVLSIGYWNIWCRRNDLIFNNIALSFAKWKVDFLKDFAAYAQSKRDGQT
jgi:hypothetical protein